MPDIRDQTVTQPARMQVARMQVMAAQAVSALILPVQASDVRWLGEEPALSEMLADPITQLLMRRDGVQEAEIRRLVARLRDRTALRQASPAKQAAPQTAAQAGARRAANDLTLDQPL